MVYEDDDDNRVYHLESFGRVGKGTRSRRCT
jgi:hypothetical protein